jgi:hypothetical protein
LGEVSSGTYRPIFEERKDIGWWKMGIWRLKGMRGNIAKDVCPVCRMEGVTSCNVKVQGSGGTDGWKESLLVYIQR